MPAPLNVLFLSTANSARSILAEALTNSLSPSAGRFRGFSAGSRHTGMVHPYALDLLREQRMATEGLRSKGWDEFAAAGAPTMHFVFTVCDRVALEPWPVFPGQPVTAHWGLADPAAAAGCEDERRRAFRKAFLVLKRRIELLACLPIETLSGFALQDRVRQLGQDRAAVQMRRL